jgi:hypothetical protein
MSVPVAALVHKPEWLSLDEASTVGVNFVVAWYGAVEAARHLETMSSYFESGDFRPLANTAGYSLGDASLAYQAVADHKAGRVVIHP